ncbi:BTAD domain-containing putative transcriptional regulator [Micromonospora sp. NPDC051925]|uniref:AfsR/SARP family transcriptional regulator n=1 Tax=Micromonospora sp. NPDC051925 TaxID=3364288 RepID=UPI0037CA0967
MVIRFRLLGAVEAFVDGTAVDLGHSRQRHVLAVLLVEANRVVHVDQLLDRVWVGRSPQRAHSVLYSYLSRLRRCLSSAEDLAIVRQQGGYLLRVDPMAVDLHRFQELVARARLAGDDAQALCQFDEALGLWRGEPFARLDHPWFDTLRTSLQQARLTAERDRTDIALRRGQHSTLLSELSREVAEQPLDERLAGQLMLALSRSGRQAEALDRYQRIRRAWPTGWASTRGLTCRSCIYGSSTATARPPPRARYGHLRNRPLATRPGSYRRRCPSSAGPASWRR